MDDEDVPSNGEQADAMVILAILVVTLFVDGNHDSPLTVLVFSLTTRLFGFADVDN